jgi:hypothetical protein
VIGSVLRFISVPSARWASISQTSSSKSTSVIVFSPMSSTALMISERGFARAGGNLSESRNAGKELDRHLSAILSIDDKRLRDLTIQLLKIVSAFRCGRSLHVAASYSPRWRNLDPSAALIL